MDLILLSMEWMHTQILGSINFFDYIFKNHQNYALVVFFYFILKKLRNNYRQMKILIHFTLFLI